jgi:thiosulfate/3-mercaptopyruvate sulfurtransferase
VFAQLIQTFELLHHLGKPDWAVIDARFYLPEPERGEAEFLEAHVPGALYAHLDRDLSGPTTGRNGRHPMPSVEQMTDRFSRWGIDDSVQVVVYDTSQGQMASRLWWMLRYLGHDAVAVLDGGFAAWLAEERPAARGRETRARRRFVPHARDEMRVDVQTLEASLGDLLLIDARAPERFRGEVEPLDPVAGHIPGARNHPTSSSLGSDGRFLTAEVLRERLRSFMGDGPPTSVVSYCGSGVTACHNLLAMDIAGMRGARLYAGSWSEWCADEARPIETGEREKG